MLLSDFKRENTKLDLVQQIKNCNFRQFIKLLPIKQHSKKQDIEK